MKSSAGEILDKKWHTPLMQYARKGIGAVDNIKKILNGPAERYDINHRDINGNNILHISASRGSERIVKLI